VGTEARRHGEKYKKDKNLFSTIETGPAPRSVLSTEFPEVKEIDSQKK
jgi:hypothetical protein